MEKPYRHLKYSSRLTVDSVLRRTKSGAVIMRSSVRHARKKKSQTKSLQKPSLDAIKVTNVTTVAQLKPEPVFVVPDFFVKYSWLEKLKDFKLSLEIRQVSMAAALGALFVAFGLGSWYGINSFQTNADLETKPQVLGEATTVPAGSVALVNLELKNQDAIESLNDNLFNTPIEYLQSYIDQASKPDVLELRTQKINQLLKDMNSPLVVSSDTIAKQSHWKLILAIAFAESTMGKNCTDNNCSNIGVAPGHRLWRKYETYSDWVVDFNRLLEKRYKDWTLNQMCGVYVQPCNKNWLLATQQILDKLEAREIE